MAFWNRKPLAESAAEKRLAEMHHGGATSLPFFGSQVLTLNQGVAGDTRNYAHRVGDGIDASVVMAPIQWIQRAIAEAPLTVDAERGDEWEPAPTHPLARLLDEPNAGYTGTHLLQATIYSLLVSGNAYWITPRTELGMPAELWYAPHWSMEAKRAPGDDAVFIDHYDYNISGKLYRLEPDEVVHFREGINPRNPRLGLSPIHAALREIWMDMEATTFAVALLANNAIPGVLFSPTDGLPVNPADVETLKRSVREQFTGEKRGGAMFASRGIKVDRLGWNPKEMDLSSVRDVTEERVCAMLGLPSAVVGFGSGLEQTKVGATMTELRRLAWVNGILPRADSITREIERSLLPAFTRGRQPGNLRVRFDYSGVAAMQEDRDKLVARMDRGYRGGWITRGEARRAIGLDSVPADEVYMVPMSSIEQPQGQARPALPPPETRGRRGQGTQTKDDFPQPTEAEALANAPVARPTAAQTRYATESARRQARIAAEFAVELEQFYLREIGGRLRRVVSDVLREVGKQAPINPQDAMIAERLMEAARMADTLPIYRQLHEATYLHIAQETANAYGIFGLATDLPDPVARSIVATLGTRMGLIDLDGQTRRALFDALTEARALGEGADATAARIVAQTPAGPWSSPEIRARVVARTEARYAQNISTLEMGREMEAPEYVVFDAALGPTDETCEMLNGRVVSHETAMRLVAEEHPNGTRDFAPKFE